MLFRSYELVSLSGLPVESLVHVFGIHVGARRSFFPGEAIEELTAHTFTTFIFETLWRASSSSRNASYRHVIVPHFGQDSYDTKALQICSYYTLL